MKKRMKPRKQLGKVSTFLKSLKRPIPNTTPTRRAMRYRLNSVPSSSKMAQCSVLLSKVFRTNKYAKGGFGRTGRTPKNEQSLESKS
jgi:hypothetical protein